MKICGSLWHVRWNFCKNLPFWWKVIRFKRCYGLQDEPIQARNSFWGRGRINSLCAIPLSPNIGVIVLATVGELFSISVGAFLGCSLLRCTFPCPLRQRLWQFSWQLSHSEITSLVIVAFSFLILDNSSEKDPLISWGRISFIFHSTIRLFHSLGIGLPAYG